MPITPTQLSQLYLAYLGRPPDADGVGYYLGRPGESLWSVAEAFSASPEAHDVYQGGWGAGEVQAVYQRLFNRAAEDAAVTYWTHEVSSGRLPPALAAWGILVGARNADRLAVEN